LDWWWIVFLAALVGIGIFLVLMPVRLRLELQGRGDPDGNWALAGGGQLGPLAVSGVAARGITAVAQMHVFGRRIWQRPVRELVQAKPADRKQEPERAEPLERARAELRAMGRRYAQLERWLDPLDLLLYAAGEQRRIRIERIDLDLGYSFEDVALTGKVMAAVYVLNGALPPRFVVRQRVSWESQDRAELAFCGRIKLWPGLLLIDTAVYVLRNVKLRKAKMPETRPSPETHEGKSST
jgi:hypothetical protein